ncbi:MAG: biotin carboxylase [Actinobacteria bacterium]|nr:biotin carboxylase [Actinomycetota bacterium]
MIATVVAVLAAPGDEVAAGMPMMILEAMKMEHVVGAPTAGAVDAVRVALGATVVEGEELARIRPGTGAVDTAAAATNADLDTIRADLSEVFDRRATVLDAARPEAVAKRHRLGRRTARENVDDLCDPGTFLEYGALAVAAQRARRDHDDLVANTPADGLVAGIGHVNGEQFADDASRCAVLSYDYMVLAGTQGYRNHHKKDRLFDLVERLRLPTVLFAEGGGGRPGDTDVPAISGNDVLAFTLFARLSGLVPLVGIGSGRCFAGNAALLGCCDVIIATTDANIGMGGPAMIEGGGLGRVAPEEIGPVSVQAPNGVIDVLVHDDAEAVAAAKRYLSYFQGRLERWEATDQRAMRELVPENRKRVYDVRSVIATLCDTGSVLELRAAFGFGIVTALARIEGRPVGIVANNPTHLGGAIDADGADKAARFMECCDTFDLPLVFLADTPGFMVGPEAERSAQVRRFARMFTVGANVTVPFCTVILRKGYGLGALAMAGGSFRAPLLTVAWPTGEVGGMGLEGAVQLGFRRELEAIEDSAEREAVYERMVAAAYERSKALNAAEILELDDVIDPADTRARIAGLLRACRPPPPRAAKKRPNLHPW